MDVTQGTVVLTTYNHGVEIIRPARREGDGMKPTGQGSWRKQQGGRQGDQSVYHGSAGVRKTPATLDNTACHFKQFAMLSISGEPDATLLTAEPLRGGYRLEKISFIQS
jgi:hypothetical protein